MTFLKHSMTLSFKSHRAFVLGGRNGPFLLSNLGSLLRVFLCLRALRIILRVVGMKYQQRVNMKINEPSGGYRGNTTSHAANADDVDAAIADLKDDVGVV